LLGGVEVDVPKRMYYVDPTGQGLLQIRISNPDGKTLKRVGIWRGLSALAPRMRTADIGPCIDRQNLCCRHCFIQKIIRPENLVRLPSLLAAAGD